MGQTAIKKGGRGGVKSPSQKIMIATSYLQNYPKVKQIFHVLGCPIVDLSHGPRLDKVFSRIDKTSFDGLLLLGGPDVHPLLYKQQPKYPHLSRQNWQRDNIEWYLLHTALERNVPILGTCRGMQLLNVALGGDLWQDLRRDGIGEVNHRGAYHNIMVKAPLKGKIPLKVNSRHHQAVNRVAPCLKPVAWASDGVIEAIYKPGVLGIQWHPEDLFFEDGRWAKLYRWFISGLR